MLEQVTTVKRDNRTFVLTAAGEVPRKQWIIDRFNENYKRGEIAKALGVPVQIVFVATRGLTNEHHKETIARETGASRAMIINPTTGEEQPRGQVIRELYESGMSRNDIAKLTETSYQVVYSYTKPRKEELAEATN